QLDRTSSAEMRADPDIRAAFGDSAPTSYLESIRQKLAHAVGLEDAELRQLFRGRMVYYAPLTGREHEPAAFIAGIGDAGLARKVYDKAVQRLSAAYGSHETSALGSQTIDEFHRAS